MSVTADVLLVLSSLALRMQFLRKAICYARIGVSLFPDDIRLREIYAFALLLDGNMEEAEQVIDAVETESRNIAYLRVQTSMQIVSGSHEKRDAIRTYLRRSI
ncbi:hypothetical protein [Brucella intermedia]|uniref:hypothetical protein n=1 Tax=Brucella intermedia TaxID=94625 RepID=UPI0023603811|nr:hypothetical protein [Brucella intermedia]